MWGDEEASGSVRGYQDVRGVIDRHWGQLMARAGASAFRGEGCVALGTFHRRSMCSCIFPSGARGGSREHSLNGCTQLN